MSPADAAGGEKSYSIEERLRRLEIENAERKPVSELVKLFLYFLFALSVVLGAFGWKQLSDVGQLVADQVELKLPRDQQKFTRYKRLIDETEDLHKEFVKLFGKYEEALGNYAQMDKVAGDFDIEGRCAIIFQETEERAVKKPRAGDYKGTLLEESWRLGAISTLRLLAEAQKARHFDDAFIFNASQTCSQLKQYELALELMRAAYEKHPDDAPIKAGMLSETARSAAAKEDRDEAFTEIMKMVENLDANSPHIVLSEAWNVVENERRYDELLKAIESCVQNPDSVKPSYLYTLQAKLWLRRSTKNSVQEAKSALAKAKETLGHESIFSVWFEKTMRDLAEMQGLLEMTELMHQTIAEGVLPSASKAMEIDNQLPRGGGN